jgi:hypothetical protein
VGQFRYGATVTLSPTLTPFTSEPISVISPLNSWPIVHGNDVKGVAVGDSLSRMRFRSLPQNPQKAVLIFTHWGDGSDGSGTSARRIVARGP